MFAEQISWIFSFRKENPLFLVTNLFIFLVPFCAGRFYIDKDAVKKVDQITEDCPSKYKENPFILKLNLHKHGDRVLYMILENEQERDLWMKAYENYFQVRAFVFLLLI